MVHELLLAWSLLLPYALGAGLYPKTGPVLNLDGRSYDSLIAKSNHTSIVEFYAPWCGHCQNLKPAYEKAAKSLNGLAKVAAINCDDEENKPFCGGMGIKGFPTLKIVRPNPKKPGSRPIVEDYQGPRNAKEIVEAVIDKIPNHVKKLKDTEVEAWTGAGGHKLVLFTDKSTVSALLKSLAVDFLGVISFGQVKGVQSTLARAHDIEQMPSLLLLPADGGNPTTYSGAMKRDGMRSFLKTLAEPNPDPQVKGDKASSAKQDKSKASKNSSAYSKAASSHAKSEAKPTQNAETIIDDGPFPSPGPEVKTEKPVKINEPAPKIQTLSDATSLQQSCLNDKASTCILLMLPDPHPENPYPEQSVTSLSEVEAKHKSSGRKLFPFFQLPKSNAQAEALRLALNLDDGVEIIAVNAKRSWWRRYDQAQYAQRDVEDWIDRIRMGEGKKEALPASLIVDSSSLPQKPVQLSPEQLEELKLQDITDKLPEGVELQMEEITDDMYEELTKSHEKQVPKNEAETHDEL